MTKEEIRNYIIKTLHKDYAFWYRILGEMYEITLGFKQYGIMELRIDKKRYKFEWFENVWTINELR